MNARVLKKQDRSSWIVLVTDEDAYSSSPGTWATQLDPGIVGSYQPIPKPSMGWVYSPEKLAQYEETGADPNAVIEIVDLWNQIRQGVPAMFRHRTLPVECDRGVWYVAGDEVDERSLVSALLRHYGAL